MQREANHSWVLIERKLSRAEENLQITTANRPQIPPSCSKEQICTANAQSSHKKYSKPRGFETETCKRAHQVAIHCPCLPIVVSPSFNVLEAPKCALHASCTSAHTFCSIPPKTRVVRLAMSLKSKRGRTQCLPQLRFLSSGPCSPQSAAPSLRGSCKTSQRCCCPFPLAPSPTGLGRKKEKKNTNQKNLGPLWHLYSL